MKKLFIFFTSIVLLTTILTLTGCSKSSPVETKITTKDILTGCTWQVSKVYDVTNNGRTDITFYFSNVYQTFYSNGTYAASVQNGNWELSQDELTIIFDKGTLTQISVSILEISKEKLKIKMPYISGSSIVIIEIEFLPAAGLNYSPITNFDALWKEFDARYSFFVIKKINWDSLYTVYRAKITEQTTEQQLFSVMSSMIANLKDGHATLTAPFANYGYNYYEKYPKNFISTQAITPYLSKDYGTLADGKLRFGKIENNIGYIYIGPNLSGSTSVWSNAIDVIIDSLKNTKGIIVDIRSNGGGSDALGKIVASRFTAETRIYNYISFRNGTKHTDFTPLVSDVISPAGKIQYTKPVAYLTNRENFSSAEGTTLMFRVLPNVTTIGDTTGGGSANPITLKLPNGWSYRVSRWIQYTADKKVFEGVGLAPDIPVTISQADFNSGKDAILERAVQYIKNK
ncbi:MAG: S41 family peptidase [Melioribacteraceae bacterium]